MLKAVKRAYGYFVVRPLQRFNVINRGHKLIEKQEKTAKPPVIAPWHPGTKEKVDQLVAPKRDEIRKDILERKVDLDNRLKEVKVVHHVVDDKPLSEEDAQMRELIKDRARRYKAPRERKAQVYTGWWHQYVEPDEVPEGKITLTNAMRMMAMRYTEPEKYSVEELAKKGHLDVKDAENVFQYFKPFKAWVPSEETTKFYEEGYYIVAPKENFNLFALTTGDLDEEKERIEEEKERQFIEEMTRRREEAIAAGKPINELPPIPLTKKEQAALDKQKEDEQKRLELIEKKKVTFWEEEEKPTEEQLKKDYGPWGPKPFWADGWDRIFLERNENWKRMDKEKQEATRKYWLERMKELGPQHEPPPPPRLFPDDHPFAHLYNPPKKEPSPAIEGGEAQSQLEGGSQNSDVPSEKQLPSSKKSETPLEGPKSPLSDATSLKDGEDSKDKISAKAVGSDSSRNS